MALLCVVAAYNEERLLADCVRSALSTGVDEVHVFDGAWRAGQHGPAFAGARKAASTDATADVAREAGAVFHPRRGFWPDQGAKRTAAFHQVGAGRGDHLFIVDADERVTGRFPPGLADGPSNVILRSVGPNDLPGVRANFPKGDYSAKPRPCLRVFAWRPDLACICPGHYVSDGVRVEPYDGRGRTRLPLIDTVLVEHHPNLRDTERLGWKRDYYAVDHPARRGRIAAGLRALRDRQPARRGTSMAQKRIADRRIIGRHPVTGREVLVAAKGRPIPDWYQEPAAPEAQSRPAPAEDHARARPNETAARQKPRSSAKKSATKRRSSAKKKG